MPAPAADARDAGIPRALPALTLRDAVGILALFAVALFSTRVSVDSDTWWHLLAGRWMVQHHAVLTQDWFSWTRAGTRWLDHSWLSEIGWFAIWDRWGFGGLNVAAAALALAAWALVYAQAPGNVYVRACVVCLAASASAFYVVARPELVSFVLLSAFAHILARFRGGVNRLWMLPPLMCLWVNLHGGFVAGFLLLVATLGGLALTRLIRGADAAGAGRRDLAWLGAATLACVAVVPLNPFGVEAIVEPLRTISIPFLRQFVFEWQSPDFHLVYIQGFGWLLLLTLASLGLSRRRIEPADLVVLAVFLALALDARRNIPLYALVAAPVIVRHGSDVLDDAVRQYPRLAFLRGLAGGPADAGLAGRGVSTAGLVPWVAVAAGAAALIVHVTPYLSRAANEATIATRMPAGAVRFLRAARPPGPMFNFYNWGGYLAWSLYPDYQVYVDGRTDLYGEPFLETYARVRAGEDEWRGVFHTNGIRLVIVDSGSPLAFRLRAAPGWRQAYADRISSVFTAETAP